MSGTMRKRTRATGPGTALLVGLGLFALGASEVWALPAVPAHYAVTAKTPVSMTLTGLLTVDGAPAGTGVEVAVFDPQNVLCGVSGVDAANGGAFVLHVYGDDPTTAQDEGMTSGNALRFEVWGPVGPTVHAHDELRFVAAAFGTAPPAYPPVFADRAAYSLRISTNHVAAFAASGAKSVEENTNLSFTVSATDPDGDSLTYATSGALPGGASFDPATRTFSWTPGYAQAGGYSVTFTASDGMLSASQTVAITVNNVNRSPVFVALGAKTVDENALLSFTVQASDPDGDPVTYGTSGNLPAGSSFDPATRAFSWTPGYAQAGGHSVTFTATDGSLTATQTVGITVNNVNRAPTANAGALSVTEDTPRTGTLGASDPDGDPLTYSLEAGQGPQLGSVVITNPSTGAYTYTPNLNASGADSFAFRASDGTLASNAATVAVTVAAVNDPPVLAAIGNKAVDEGQLLSFVVSATDAEGNTLTYTAAPLPSGATFDAGTRTFSWTPGFTQAGNFDVTFTVTDNGTPAASDAETVTITVGAVNQPPELASIGAKAVDEGQTVSFAVSATDPNADTLTYSASPLPAGASFDPATRVFSWTPQYGQAGGYSVTFTVADGGTPALADAETVAVTVAPAVVTVSIPLQAGWNLVSFPLAVCSYTGAAAPAVALPPGTVCSPVSSIGDFFSGIAGQYDRIESFDAAGAHVYDPNVPAYVNDLTYVAGGYGYRIKMKQASTLTVTGRRLPPAAALSLGAGWTLAGYWGLDVRHTGAPPSVSFPAGVSFTQVGSIADVFTPSLGAAPAAVWSIDANGDHTYPTALAPATPVTYLGPGYGYWIKVSAPANLDYDLP